MPSQWSPHPVFLHPSKSHTKRGKRVCAMRASESRMFFLDDVRITYIISTFNDFAYILSEDQTSPNPTKTLPNRNCWWRVRVISSRVFSWDLGKKQNGRLTVPWNLQITPFGKENDLRGVYTRKHPKGQRTKPLLLEPTANHPEPIFFVSKNSWGDEERNVSACVSKI